jgi:hypothetical protein
MVLKDKVNAKWYIIIDDSLHEEAVKFPAWVCTFLREVFSLHKDPNP